jgi:LAO/AO transport system kinase
MTSESDLKSLTDRLGNGDTLALSKLISAVEDGTKGYRAAMDAVYQETGNAWVIGVTGPPGVGKSTLVDKLTERFRDRDFTVGIIAVDPSSPFSGGAVLGDRVRMKSTMNDSGVFCRSMSARGNVGGLSSATYDTVYLMDMYGLDVIIIETVGAGQSEIDIVRTADTVLVAANPSAGDEVQTVKAGILEIGDVFAVNKADLEGSGQTVQQLREMVSRRSHDEWKPPVNSTSATGGTGLDELFTNLQNHRDHLRETDAGAERRRRRVQSDIQRQVEAIVEQRVERQLDTIESSYDTLIEDILRGDGSPYSVAQTITSSDASS